MPRARSLIPQRSLITHPPTQRLPAYHAVNLSLTIMGPIEPFSREGMVPTIIHMQRLAACGVGFHSFTEAHLATDSELVRNILLALLASPAKLEAKKISERTKAGMARARLKGKQIGRPTLSKELQLQPADRVAQAGAYAAAKELGLDRKTAMKYGS
jgi:resolvase-like protein